MRRVLVLLSCLLPMLAYADAPVPNVDLDAARASYRQFLELAPAGDPRRAKAMRRLADLELEHAETLLLEDEDEDAAAEAYAEAVRLYREVLIAFPDDPANDHNLYQLARAHEQRGEQDEALAVMAELVRDHGASGYLGESHFRRGEWFFSQGDFVGAGSAYAAVLGLGSDAAFYEQALYKHGWSLFRQMRYEGGLESFLELGTRMLVVPGETYDPAAFDALSRAERELLEDAFRAMSISFSYLEGVDSLNAFLDARELPGFAYLLYQHLGDLYLAQERYNDAAASYGAFAQRYPDNDRAPFLQLAVIDTYKVAGFADKVLAAKEAFVEQYALTGSFWIARTPDDAPELVAALKSHLSDLTQHYHALAQAGGQPQDYEQAIRWYRIWLDSFPDDTQAPDTRFLLAELLFEQGSFGEATFEYERTAYEYGDHERAAESGYAALLSYQRHRETMPVEAQGDWQRLSIDSALRFADTFPQHEQATAVLTGAAEDLFELGEYTDALAAGERLVAWDPPAAPALRRTAWTVIAHASFDASSYANAERAYGEVLALLPPDDPIAGEITEKLAASVYKQGEQRRDSGDLAGAVDDFLRVAAVAPGSPIRVTAEYDAAAALVQLEDWSRATSVLEGFRTNHEGHPLQAEVTRNLALAYMESDRPLEAAGELERMARAPDSGPQERRDAAWSAATHYERGGDAGRAIDMYHYVIEELGAPLDDTIDAHEKIAALHAERGDENARLATLEAIVAVDRAAPTASERSRSAAADASLELANALLEPFQSIRLISPLQQSLARKREAMDALLVAYGASASYGITKVTTAATYQIAEVYLELGSALMDSERPAELNDDELEQYEFLLEEQSFPFEEKAIEVHQANAGRSAEGVYDDWVRQSFARLAELMPARYARVEKGETLVTYMD